MEDIATIGFGAETSGLDKAKTKLDGLVPASDKAQKASERLARQMKTDADKAAKASEQLARTQREQAETLDMLRNKYNPLYAASKKYEMALQEITLAEKNNILTEKQAITAREKAAASYLGLGKTVEDVDQKSRFAAGGGARMLGQQLSQVAQQGAVTGNYLGALAVQLPDIALGFGSIAIAASMVATVAIPFLMNAFGSGSTVIERFDDDLKSLQASLKSVNEISKIYSADGVQTLIEKYGEVDAALLRMIEHQRQLAVDQAMSDAKSVIADYAKGFTNVNALITEYDNMTKAGASDPQWLENAKAAADELYRSVGLTVDQAREMQKALADASRASTFEEQANSLSAVNEILAQSGAKASELAMRGLQAEEALRQLANSAPEASWMNAAISGVEALIKTIEKALVAKSKITGTGFDVNSNVIRPKGRPIDLGDYRTPAQLSGKTSGNKKTPLTDIEKYQKEFEKTIQVITQGKTAFSAIQAAFDTGIIGVDQYTSAISRLEAAFIAAGGSAEQWAKVTTKQTNTIAKQLSDLQKGGFESLGGAIADLASGGTVNFGEMARSIIRDMINIAIQAAIIKPLMAAFGFDKGGAFNAANLNITPNAKGNAFSNSIVNTPTMFAFAKGGALGLMGEAGPEAVMPLTRGPDGSLGVQMYQAQQGAANSAPTVQVNVINNAPNTTTREESQKQSDGTEIRNIIIDTTRDGMANGEFDGVQATRYGTRQQKVIR